MKRSLVLGFLFFPVCAFFAQTSVMAADCDGKTRQEHHVGNFNFVTSSWIDKVGNRRRYVTCVANLDAGSDLLVNWFIPGPYKQYVPATKVVKSPRVRDDINDRPIDGCLAYGGLQETTVAQFLGTAEDEDIHRRGACGETTAQLDLPAKIETSSTLENWVDDVQVFFPSDLADPFGSMLEVTGQIGINSTETGFVSFFNYYANRYGDREKGTVEAVKVRPFFPKQEKDFIAAFANTNSAEISLTPKGSIVFEVSGKKNVSWSAVPAFYEFRDRNDNLLAAIPMPLFVGNTE